jgi:hypothetical protein
LLIYGEPTHPTPESPANLSGNPSTSGAGLRSEVWVYLLHEGTVKRSLILQNAMNAPLNSF